MFDRYLGTTQSDRYLFILLEYVPGGSIAKMLEQFGAFSEDLLRFDQQFPLSTFKHSFCLQALLLSNNGWYGVSSRSRYHSQV